MKPMNVLTGLFGICAALLPQYVIAGLFCAVTSLGTQCYYDEYDACLRAAGSRGACTINWKEARPPSGYAPFCVVDKYRTDCSHYDAQSCREAAGDRGVCVTK